MAALIKSKIFKKQFAYFFTIILLTFATIAGVIFTTTKNLQKQQQLELVSAFRKETSGDLLKWFQSREEHIRIQATFFEKMNKEELYSSQTTKLIKDQLEWVASFYDIRIMDDKGNIINSKDGAVADVNLSDREYFQSAVKGNSFIQGFFLSRKDGIPILIIACPIKIDANTNYVVTGAISLQEVTNMVENINENRIGQTCLVDNQGLKITDNEYIKELTQHGEIIDKSKYKHSTLAIENLLAKEDGSSVYRDDDNEIVYGSYEWLHIADIGLVVEFKDKVVMKPINDLTKLIVILGIFVTVVGLFFSFGISKRMVGPIYALVESAEQIIENNYRKPIEVKTGSELDVLVNQFNSMQKAIENRENQLNRKNEELKEQRAEAIQANVLKSQFLANMSHELRTPLNSIIGFTGRVIKKSGEILPKTQKENLQIVLEEAQHLLALINDLLDYSKIEAGKMEVNRESFGLEEVISEVHNMMKNLIESKSLQYGQDIYDIPLPIYSDRMKIKQILINLVSNAVKYSESGKITLSVEKELDEYIIKIKDEGIGISEENIHSIFDEFRQIDGTYTRKVGGTGLGLSITKKFVEMLGGTIGVESILNQGSTFTVRLPEGFEKSEKRQITSKVNLETPIYNKKRIACIDDDQNAHRLYREYLKEQDYEVVSYSGEEDIVEELKRIQPEVVILDIMLKQKDGWEILAEIKTNNETKRIPVIMASVLSERNLAFRMKADEYIVKPVLQDEFIETIKKTIKTNEQFDVLVADDDENYLNLIAQFLKDEHINFRVARNGIEAISKINEKVPDLLVLDIMMPEKDGFSVIEDIAKIPGCESLPVIAVTAKDLTTIEKLALSKRTEAIIQKSGTHIDEVMTILVRWIGEKLDG